MSNAVAQYGNNGAAAIEAVVMKGDLSGLNAADRVAYYRAVCDGCGLNPLTRPFDYLMLNGKLVLYARKDATDQLANLKRLSRRITDRSQHDDIYLVTAEARTADGRIEESTGAVSLTGLKGEALANAYMKAETKAKRRVTLSICGLGMLDETEVETIPGATAWTDPDSPVSAPTRAALPDPDAARKAFFGEATRALSLRGLEEQDKRTKIAAALGISNEKGILAYLADIHGWDALRRHIEDGTKLPLTDAETEPETDAEAAQSFFDELERDVEPASRQRPEAAIGAH